MARSVSRCKVGWKERGRVIIEWVRRYEGSGVVVVEFMVKVLRVLT